MQELIILTSPIFIVILIGYILKLSNIIDSDFIISTNKMLFNFFLPLLLFYKIYSTSIAELPSFILLFIALLSIFLIY
ncbi:MAG: AEC family transporter, partial [Deferribacterota bacterium]|nr:AEC family transporter [Deferribacterota bacterium]